MKRYLLLLLTLGALTACTKTQSSADSDTMVPVESVEVSMGSLSVTSDGGTRSVDDFAVNTVNDPTYTLEGRTGWNFDFQIYNGATPYTPYGTASLVWDGTSRWIPAGGTTVYFPNYTRQRVTIDMYPATKDAPVLADQSAAANLLLQDILVQNDAAYRINPAHILENIPVHHRHSMIDIILREVNDQQIASMQVVAGGQTYTPYKIPKTGGFTNTEYLLILPVGVTDPVIHLNTAEGARYIETLSVTTAENVCFCVNLLGLELQLGGVTISDWTYGEAISGEYSVVTSYPTFKGPANSSLTITFANGQTQELTFNSRGEFTTRPAGRSIVAINGVTQNPPIILNGMMIDLNPYL